MMSTHQAERGRQSGEREARQIAEEARETGWDQPSFGRQLFLGDFRLDLIHPHPRPGEESSRRGEEFCARLREFCEASVDGALIERDARIPDEVVRGLAAVGAFGMKVAPEYGGAGLSNQLKPRTARRSLVRCHPWSS
jgi:Acyl-CoA dehydrogenase, N-terminal domain